jgi:hypothetical protein
MGVVPARRVPKLRADRALVRGQNCGAPPSATPTLADGISAVDYRIPGTSCGSIQATGNTVMKGVIMHRQVLPMCIAVIGIALATSAAQASWQSCFSSRQQTIVNKFRPRVNSAVGICAASRVSRDMWQAVEQAARACKAPRATISQANANKRSSQVSMNNSCTR